MSAVLEHERLQQVHVGIDRQVSMTHILTDHFPVSSFWQLETFSQDNVKETLVPVSQFDLVFPVCGTIWEYKPEHDRFDPIAGPVFDPIRERARLLKLDSETMVFGIRMNPPHCGSLIQGEVLHYGRDLLPLGEVLRRDILSRLNTIVFQSQTFDHRVEGLHRFFYESRPLQTKDSEVARKALSVLDAQCNIEISRLADMSGVSQRWLEILFLRYIGTTPKKLARIIRFNQTLHGLRCKKTSQSLAGLALDCGYYDQAHMIREMRRFAGNSPKRLLREHQWSLWVFNLTRPGQAGLYTYDLPSLPEAVSYG